MTTNDTQEFINNLDTKEQEEYKVDIIELKRRIWYRVASKSLLFFLFSILVQPLFSQNDSQNLHGTFIYEVICKDGIVVCADSRVNFEDSINGEMKSIFHFDNFKKIFVVEDYLIAFSGKSRLGSIFFSQLIGQVNLKKVKSPSDFLTEYFLIIKSRLGEDFQEFFKEGKTHVFAAGFDNNGKPIIAILDFKNQRLHPKNESFYTNQSKFVKDSLHFDKMNLKQTIKTVKRDIRRFVKNNDLSESIGGDLTVYTIEKGQSPKCVSNCNNIEMKPWKEMKFYIKSNLDLVSPHYPFTKEDALKFLNRHQ